MCLDVYLDDITLSAASTTESGLVSDLANAFVDVRTVVEDGLGANIHPGKTQVICSSFLATDRLSRLVAGGGPARMFDSYCLLGVDLRQTARWRRRRGRATTRSTRMSAAARRHRRTAIFRRLAGSRASVLFKSGIQAVAGYGVEVTGLADTCLDKLRTWACRYMCPTRSSRTAVFALEGDPTLSVSTAVASRWAREVWSSGSDLRALTLPHLITIFDEGIDARHVRSWASSKGPLSAVCLELRRLGWDWPEALKFRNDVGEDIVLTEVPPGRIRCLFEESRQRQLCGALAARASASSPSPFACVDPTPVQHILRSRKLNGREKGALKRAFQQAVFTLDRVEAAGYDLPSTLCPLCGQSQDSLHHRIFRCGHPTIAALRAQLAPAELLQEMDQYFSTSFSIHGWNPCTHHLPLPLAGDELEQAICQRAVVEGGEVRWHACEWSEAANFVQTHSARMCCFTDGSLFKDEWRNSWRAGWGVYMDVDTQPAFRLFGPVTSPSFQTVPVAEWTAVKVASGLWPSAATSPFSDCMGVVRGVNNIHAFVRRGGALAGYAKACLKHALPRFGSLFKLSKVKAHQSTRWDMDASALRAAIGNENADAAAKAGASMHPSPSPVEQAEAVHWWHRSTTLALLVGRILSCFPTVVEQFGGRLGRIPGGGAGVRATRRSVVAEASRHKFRPVGGAIVCQLCLSRARSWKTANDRTLHEKCAGQCQALVDAWLSDRVGHSLQLLSHARTATIVCVKCGAFASTHRSALLAAPCRGSVGISEQRRGGLARLLKGQHPDSRRKGRLDATWALAEGELTELTF